MSRADAELVAMFVKAVIWDECESQIVSYRLMLLSEYGCWPSHLLIDCALLYIQTCNIPYHLLHHRRLLTREHLVLEQCSTHNVGHRLDCRRQWEDIHFKHTYTMSGIKVDVLISSTNGDTLEGMTGLASWLACDCALVLALANRLGCHHCNLS
jgi:hypothetical protein